MKKAISMFVTLLLLVATAGCGTSAPTPDPAENTQANPIQTSEPTENSGDKILIGYSPMTLINPYFSAVGSAIQEVVEANGAELVQFDPQQDSSLQASQIDDMISMGVKAILIIPVDSAGSRTMLQACQEAGVFVINIDNVINEADYDVVDAIVASDNYGLGYLSGKDVVERFPDGAKIGIMHSPTSEACILTVGAFWDAIEEFASDSSLYQNVAEADGMGNMELSFA